MNKSSLYYAVIILVVYFTLVFCDELNTDPAENITDTAEGKVEHSELVEEGRLRRKHLYGLHHLWGWHALALAYFIKVKVVIVAFFVGTAVFWGLRYFWPHKCHSDIVHDGPIVYEHGPSFAHHDHIPYSLDHSEHGFDHSDHGFDHSFDASSSFGASGPYSGYENGPGGPYVETAPSTAPEAHHISRRSVHRQQQYMGTEEQIAEFMFLFLGLDSKACRRRFVCEMEFRSRHNPLTSMAFRIIGRGFFEKYTNGRNTNGQATNFFECATVNPECTVIEQSTEDENEEPEVEEAAEVESNESNSNHSNHSDNETNDAADLNTNDIDSNKVDNDENAAADEQERANEANLQAEKMESQQKRRRRRGKKSMDAVAASILNRTEMHAKN